MGNRELKLIRNSKKLTETMRNQFAVLICKKKRSEETENTNASGSNAIRAT